MTDRVLSETAGVPISGSVGWFAYYASPIGVWITAPLTEKRIAAALTAYRKLKQNNRRNHAKNKRQSRAVP